MYVKCICQYILDYSLCSSQNNTVHRGGQLSLNGCHARMNAIEICNLKILFFLIAELEPK